MIDTLLTVVHAALVLFAIVVSAAGRFPLGLFGGLLRLLVLVLVAAHARSGAAAASGSTRQVLIALVGPILTVIVLFVAYGRTSDVPGAYKAEVSRPFKAWVGVVILDAFAVASVVAQRALADW